MATERFRNMTAAASLSLLILFASAAMCAVPPTYRAAPPAISQSNRFAIGYPITDKLLDGFQNYGFKAVLDESGSFSPNTNPAVLVDRKLDATLNATIADAQRRYGQLPLERRVKALALYVRWLMHPERMAARALSDWDDKFGSEHRGERVLIGEFIKLRRGVCTHQAILLKILCDELGVKADLYFGYNGPIGHTWVQAPIDGRVLIYDPAMEIYAGIPGSVAGHKPAELVYGADMIKLNGLQKLEKNLKTGRNRAAESFLKTFQKIESTHLGEYHVHNAVALERLARLQSAMGKHDEAIANQGRALEIYVKNFGSHHAEAADANNRLGQIYRKAGESEHARICFKKAVEAYEAANMPDALGVADASYNLAALFMDERRYFEAQPLMEKALSIYQKYGSSRESDIEETSRAIAGLKSALTKRGTNQPSRHN